MQAGVLMTKRGIISQIAETVAARVQAGQDKAKKPKPALAALAEPTPEQFAAGKFKQGGHWATAQNERAGLAHRRVPVIDTLWDAGKLTEAEYSALAYYRDQASRAEDDVCQSGPLDPEKIMGGGSGSNQAGGFLPATLAWSPAIVETGRLERDLGSLLDIARAIAVDDVSLSQWCIAKHGGRERYDGKGRFVAIVPINEKRHMEIARMELRMAARRISR